MNDLIMYTLAIDRGDEEVAKIYDPAHLSVLRLIKLSSDSAKVGVPVSVCGEMAGDTMLGFVIRNGYQTLSMSISRILKVKQFITKLTPKKFLKFVMKYLKNMIIC